MRLIRVIVILVIINKPQVFASFLVDYNGAIIIWGDDDKRKEKHNSRVGSKAWYSHPIRVLFWFLSGMVVWDRPAKLYSLKIVCNSINKYQLSGNKCPYILPIIYPCGITYCELHFQRIANHAPFIINAHTHTCTPAIRSITIQFSPSCEVEGQLSWFCFASKGTGDFGKFCELLKFV